jgi:streptomycin 6-kinase
VPAVVRNKAAAGGASAWIEELPSLVSALEREWSFTAGAAFGDATEAFVSAAELSDGTPAGLGCGLIRKARPRYRVSILDRVDSAFLLRCLSALSARRQRGQTGPVTHSERK